MTALTSERRASAEPGLANSDRSMPWLAGALDTDAAARELARNIVLPGGEPLELEVFATRLVRHKPGRRCLIEYDVGITARGGTRRETLIGKSRAKGLDRRTFELIRQLRSWGFDDQSADGISVPEPLGVVPRFEMWLSRKVDGVPGGEAITGPAGLSVGARIAEAAHKVHRVISPAGPHHTVERELEILGARLKDVQARHPQWASRIGSLIRRCEETRAGVGERPVTGIHRDFYADQLLFDAERVYVVDFDLHGHGDPALDIGNALAHLTEQALRHTGPSNALDEVRDPLLNRYVELAGSSHLPAIRAYELFSLARHVAISDVHPGRSHLTEEILVLCEQYAACLQ